MIANLSNIQTDSPLVDALPSVGSLSVGAGCPVVMVLLLTVVTDTKNNVEGGKLSSTKLWRILVMISLIRGSKSELKGAEILT